MTLEAKGNSVCAFEVDHIFPWSRGGLSVPANLMALFWRSNRNIKNDKVRHHDNVQGHAFFCICGGQLNGVAV